MAVWRNILTEDSSVGTLSDVTITGASAGEILISNGSAWVDAAITGTTDEVTVSNSAGAINIALPDDVTIGNNLTATGDLVINGGEVTLNSSAVDRDATLTVKGGTTDKGAILALHAKAGAAAGDEWEIKATSPGPLTFGNDIDEAGTQVVMATLTPDATAADSTLTLTGNLIVSGNSQTFGNGATIVNTSNSLLTITEATTAFSGNVTVGGSATITGNNLIFGNGETIDNGTDGVLDMSAPTVKVSNDLDLDSDGAVLKMGADSDFTITHDGTTGATIEANPMTILSAGDIELDSATDIVLDSRNGVVKLYDESNQFAEFKTAGAASYELVIRSGTSPTDALIFSGADVEAQGELTIATGKSLRTGTIDFTDGDNAITIADGGDVTLAQDLTVNGDVTLGNASGDSVTVTGNLTVSGTTTTVNTETIQLADNTIVLNSNHTGTPTQDAGITVERGSGTDESLFWDEDGGRWAVGSGESSNEFGTVHGLLSTIETSGDEPSGDGSGVGSFWHKTGGTLYVRIS